MSDEQMDFDDVYDNFVEKFKPKKTTDDCYTPENVYNAIRDYVCCRFGCDPASIIRPFWPGGDYERMNYPNGCLVLDNPPFSIFAKIVRFYCDRGIKFFIFGPGLTIFGCGERRVSYLITGNSITYQNGAQVSTSLCHNLERDVYAEACPELNRIIKEANEINLKKQKKQVRKLALPGEVVTAANLQYMANHNTPFRILKSDAIFIRKLDNLPTGIFGGGLFLTERAAAERAAAERAAAERAAAERAGAERISFSDRERELQRHISKNERSHTDEAGH